MSDLPLLPKLILTDIEGTTTPIAFVKDVLFPYARAALPAFIREREAEAGIAACLAQVRQEMGGNAETSRDEITAELIRWLDSDRKATPLKTLQGLIWRQGYEDGSLKSPVYEDAVAALRRWRDQGIRLAVYSSGSIAAQKLLFAHSGAGDLTPLFEAYFDTTSGPKIARDSYITIAAALALAPADILFLSDSLAELDAARAAGLRSYCLDRGEAIIEPGHSHPSASSFSDIPL